MASMTNHERQMVMALCARVAGEQNPIVFKELIIELDALLQRRNDQQANRTKPEDENLEN